MHFLLSQLLCILAEAPQWSVVDFYYTNPIGILITMTIMIKRIKVMSSRMYM